MFKLLSLNSLSHASAWLAEQTGDAGYSPEYLVDLGKSKVIKIIVVIPTDTVIPPKGWGVDRGYGLQTGLFDGIFEFSSMCCHLMQTKGHTSVPMIEVRNGRFVYELKSVVNVTMDMLRIKKSELEALAVKSSKLSLATNAEYGLPEQEAIEPGNSQFDHLPNQKNVSSDADKPHLLFDPVKAPQLEKMFPFGGRWARYIERAKRFPDLLAARESRAALNPYLAAEWWIKQGQDGWDWARCLRVLENNLPTRSRDSQFFKQHTHTY